MATVDTYTIYCPVPPAYDYTVRLEEEDLANICIQISTIVYSPASSWAVGMVLYADSGLTTILSGYIYVDYIVTGEIFNLNIGTGVVGSYTGSNC